MNTKIALALISAFVYVGVSAGHQENVGAPITKTDTASIRQALTPLGWNWVEKEDAEGLMSFQLVDGEIVRFALYQYRSSDEAPVNSLGLSAGYDLAGKVDPRLVNDWNKLTRFTKAYYDEEGDPFLTSDLRVGSGANPAVVTEFVKEFSTEQKEFERVVLGREVVIEPKLLN